MTCADLAKLIVERLKSRALEQPDPIQFFAKAVARVSFLERRAALTGDMEGELIKFANEFGLLNPNMKEA